MPETFHYAACSYLNEWISKDKGFHEILSFEANAGVDPVVGRKTLIEAANYYRVIRTFKRSQESDRLQDAYQELSGTGFLSRSDVTKTVCEFAKSLKEKYGLFALSAASKFLWMRFRSPIVIYDSLVRNYLGQRQSEFSDEVYKSYYLAWRTKYEENHERVREACGCLIAIKKFTRASGIEDEKLFEWTTSEWFMERVFDHYMLNNTPRRR
jgi:hypothetical protein